MVSCSSLSSFWSIVAAAFRSSAPPQEEQKRPVGDTFAPQDEQYMGSGILSPEDGPARFAAKAHIESYEMRST